MKRLSLAFAASASAVAAAAAIACGGPSSPASPAMPLLIPVQPPQPSPVASSSSSPRRPDAPRAAAPFKCDSGIDRALYFRVGARSYCAYDEPDTWEASERRCVANGGHLMAFDSEATSEAARKALASPLGARRAAWIGLELKNKKKAGGPDEWKWSSGDAVKTPMMWNDGEPNNFGGNEGCGEFLVVDGRWNDTRCDQMQPYLCQSKKSGAPIKGGGLSCHQGRIFTAAARTYCLNDASLAFADAKKACAADNGQLAELTTYDDSRAIREEIGARFPAPTMWIGLTDGPEEGNWGWSSGLPRTFEAWAPGEPNDFGDEDCAQLFADTWTWNDLDCERRLPSVCEGRE